MSDIADQGLKEIYSCEEMDGQIIALGGRVFALLAIAILLVVVSYWPDFLYHHALLTEILMVPNPMATLQYPTQLTYLLNNSIYLYVVLLGLAFFYRPRTVIVGITGVVCWGAGLLWILSLPVTLSFLNVPKEKFIADPFGYFGNIYFIDLGIRLQEGAVFIICPGLVATLVARSRRLVYRQATAV